MSFYDRDNNITGVETLTGLTFSPDYGSTATFETRSSYFPFSDKVSNNVSAGLNSVVGRYNLKFQLRESDAQKLVNFYESQSGTGIFAVSDGSSIYRTLSGSIEDLQFSTQNNGKYNIDLSFDVDRNASPLKWSGQSFVNHDFQKWQSGVSFQEDDIVYFEHDLEEPTNNFFYCSSSHLSALSNHPLSTGQKWTTNLFSQPNDQFSVRTKPLVSKTQLKGSFTERIKEQKNIHSLDGLEFNYKNISDKKTKALLHFLEGRLGYKRFEYQPPEIYNRPKTFFAPSWTHQWNYKDSNNLTISASEDPFGMIASGKPNFLLVQDSGRSSLVFSVTGHGNLFLDSGNGKQLLSSVSNTINWNNTSKKNAAKIYGRIAGFTGTSQSLVSAKISSAALTHLNLSENSLFSLSLTEANNLQELRAQNNNIGGFDLARKPNLEYADISNNGLSYLEIGDSPDLTELYAQNNSLPPAYLNGALQDLVSNRQLSGVVNFSNNSGLSPSSLSYVSTLTGRFWNVDYEYYPLVVDSHPSPSISFAPVDSFPFIVAISDTHENACLLVENINCLTNSGSFSLSTRINFSETSAIDEYQIGDRFYVQGSGFTLYVEKICCDIAAYVSGPESCVVSTSPSSSVSPTDSSASNVSVSMPCMSASPPSASGPSNTSVSP